MAAASEMIDFVGIKIQNTSALGVPRRPGGAQLTMESI